MFPHDTHNISLGMQEVRLGVPLSEMEAWEKMKQKTPDLSQPQPSLPEYFGKAQENKSLYCEAFTSLHPEVDDPTLVEKSPLVPVGEGLLYRFPNRYRPIGTKGQDLLYRFVTNRYKRPSTWARRGDRDPGPLVPVCDTNRY